MDAPKVGSDIKEKSSYSVLHMFIELLSNEGEASKEENDQSKSNKSESSLNFILSLLCWVTLHLHIFLHKFHCFVKLAVTVCTTTKKLSHRVHTHFCSCVLMVFGKILRFF